MTEGEAGSSTGGETLLPQPRGGARTWYEVLELDEHASEADVTKAYERALALVEGRSIGGYLMLDPMAAESARADVEAAFAILGHPERRAAYDRERGRSAPDRTTPERPASEKPTPAGAAEPRPQARPTDEEVAEARAVLGLPVEAGRESDLPRRVTPLKFLSPVPADVAPGAPNVPARMEQARSDTGRELAPYELGASTPPRPAGREHDSAPPTVQSTMPPAAAMPAPTPPATGPTVAGGAMALPDGPISGAVIKEFRVARGLSIDDVAEATKIRKPYLRAIEEEDLSGLPARVYLRGFLTQVARVLRVERARLAEGYLAFLEQKGGAPKE